MKHLPLIAVMIALGLAPSAPVVAQSTESTPADTAFTAADTTFADTTRVDTAFVGGLGAWMLLQAADSPPTATLRARDADRYLGVRCESGRTYAFVAWDSLLGPAPRVTYRIDDGEAVESIWNAAADGDAAFFPGRTVDFVSRLSAHDSLTAAFTSAGDSTATTFDLHGIQAALRPIRESCRW
ncbi:MAG: type VI secretion system-associated protein TagO [Rhodothermales bacterium]|nr:type VI secretion system-associated protein TagO [Rhodothermales bacterium]